MSYASEDSKPFLASDIDEQDSFDLTPSERPTSQYQSSSKPLWRRNLWIVHVLFLVLNIGFFLYNMGYVGTKTGPDQAILEQTYSPAREAISYRVREEPFMLPPSLLTGPPSDAADAAWAELEKPFMMRFTKEEMDRMGKTSLALKDGSGYIGYLETFHMLHCVQAAWKSQYMDRYGSHHSVQPWHLGHCLNVLVQGIMCNADSLIGTYFWQEGGTIKGKEMTDIEANRTGHRQCTDFSKLREWATERTIHFDVHDTDSFLRTLVPEN